MRIVDVRERTISISRYRDPALGGGALTTSLVAVVTDARRDGAPLTGFGFASFGRFAQGGLIRERFAPRLIAAAERDLAGADGAIDPLRAWSVMMRGEKPGGHGERCVAVGALDMALWDLAAKAAEMPLYRFLSHAAGTQSQRNEAVEVYAGGGYVYPERDVQRLVEEIQMFSDLGYARVKIKIGDSDLARARARIEAVLEGVPASSLAVDAMNAYDASHALAAASALRPYGLWWFEDVCDPLDFDTLRAVKAAYGGAIAAGEALFSLAEARLVHRYGGLDPHCDILLFDPVHCYGIPEYLRIVAELERAGWPRRAFWPHGGHLFGLHVAAGLGLGGAEVNPFAFAPLGGLHDGARIVDGRVAPPDAPGIGFELQAAARAAFATLR